MKRIFKDLITLSVIVGVGIGGFTFYNSSKDVKLPIKEISVEQEIKSETGFTSTGSDISIGSGTLIEGLAKTVVKKDGTTGIMLNYKELITKYGNTNGNILFQYYSAIYNNPNSEEYNLKGNDFQIKLDKNKNIKEFLTFNFPSDDNMSKILTSKVDGFKVLKEIGKVPVILSDSQIKTLNLEYGITITGKITRDMAITLIKNKNLTTKDLGKTHDLIGKSFDIFLNLVKGS